MTDAPETETGQTRAVAVRERLVTQAPVAIWDTADFEQMQRVGVVLARSGLVPESLCTEKQKDDQNKDIVVLLPEAVIAARCVLICNQARLWGADPLNVLQCTSLINGRLMYEGKLVNAIVQHLTGVKLRFELGRWNTDHFESADDRSGLGEALAIRCFDPEDPEREVSGSVGMWKTARANSPWSMVGNWPRQLRYRASREWARAYEPGAILGILAEGDQEIEDLRVVEPTGPGLMARLSGHQNGEGFDPENGNGHTPEGHEGVKGKRAARKKAAEALPAPEAEAPATPAAETVAEALDGDDLPEGLRPQPDAPAVEEPTESSTSNTTETSPEAASEEPTDPAGTAPTASPSEDAEFTEVITEGYPAENEIYMLNGDEWVDDAKRGEVRRDTYKNGEPFSDAGRDKGYKVYEDHAPASNGGTEEEATDATEETEAADDFPADFAKFIDAIEGEKAVNTWAEVKVALSEFMKGPTWAEMDDQRRNRQRGTTWTALTERKVDWLPSPALDLSAFRLWLETTPTALQAKQTFDALTETETFKNAAEATRKTLIGAVAARLDFLKGA